MNLRILGLLCLISTAVHSQSIEGELKKWHRIALTFNGPSLCENSADNPFLNYRLQVRFQHVSTGILFTVPGFFAADGHAAESGAACGDQWRVYFSPPDTGRWRYEVSFRNGPDIAVADAAGTPLAFDGTTGTLMILPGDKSGRDLRAKGRLSYVGQRYMRFAESREYYIKGGSGSPENLLAYADFDSTYNDGGIDYIKTYSPHVGDWNSGDPVWHGSKGKGLIGAINYLASKGMNVMYFLTLTVDGDGNDVWPWNGPYDFTSFDVSKLDQWEIVFDHMERKGLVMHMVLQEQENTDLLDNGELGPHRKLYYRELIARFGHHLGLIWNLSEENQADSSDNKAYSAYIKSLDAYQHLLVTHTYPFEKDDVYDPLLGFTGIDGASLQVASNGWVDHDTETWIQESAMNGRPWVVFLSEIGPANDGVLPDAIDPEHNDTRTWVLWQHLIHGGAGTEWYFGYNYAHNDLNCEDFRSRENMWDQTAYALDFFSRIPFHKMESRNDLVSGWQKWCLADEGKLYVIHLPEGGTTDLDINVPGTYRVGWFNPRTGGKLMDGGQIDVTTAGSFGIGDAPTTEDWIAVVLKRSSMTRTSLEFTAPGVVLYPNPSSARVIIELASVHFPDEIEFELMDIRGRVVKTSLLQQERTELQLSDLPAGLYIYRLSSSRGFLDSGRLVISR